MRRLVYGWVVGTMIMLSGSAVAATLEVGKPFPDLVLPALEDGRPLSIADFKGERVVLHVFASW